MAYKINQGALKAPTGGNKLKPPATINKDSSNARYGMADVPAEQKKREMTPDEAKEAIKRGELMYGPVPMEPVMEICPGVRFDFNDGLRVKIESVPEGQPKKQYYIHMVEDDKGIILHSGILESGAFVSTAIKFYCKFGLQVILLDDLPDDVKKRLMESYDVDEDTYQFLMSMARMPDVTAEIMAHEYESKDLGTKPYDTYLKICRWVLGYVEDNYKFKHIFDPTNKEIIVQLPVGTIGDSVGWFSYMERFQQKTKCKLICVMNPVISVLFKDQYPEITFISPKETENYKPYACFRLGLFFKSNTTDQPYDFRYIGNHRTASKILDVNDDDIAPRANLSKPRMIKEPYVCVAVQASAYCKLWLNPTGWIDVISHLKDIGYRVLCIDKDKVTGSGIAINKMPWGVEDYTGNRPLQERIDLLKDCDFFIGLSSGVSWLAWCAQCPVVLISGFTNPFNEFYTPYRVINTLTCHGCWNDERCEFDHFDYMWCPRHKGTEKAYLCSRDISSRLVLNTIAKIPAYQKQLEKHNKEMKEKEQDNG